MEVVYPLGLISQESLVRIQPPQPIYAWLTQLVEFRLYTAAVGGSSPSPGTR